MGTGKTAIGKELARFKKWRFTDLDSLIELREEMAIADIFSKKGEAYFRRLENLVLREVAEEEKFVVACGGGIVTDQQNINIMKNTGVMICLISRPEVILKRTKASAHRPLLNVGDPKKKIEELLMARAPFYAQADKTLDVSDISVEESARQILELISLGDK